MSCRWLVVTLALPVLAACAHADKKASEAQPSSEAKATASAAPAQAASPPTRTCSADDQCGANEICVSSRCVAITPQIAECRTSAHFDFDRANLQAAELPQLQRVARCLKALPEEKTLVEGSCDERGAVQYNVALGFKRAHAAAKYLEDLGIPSKDVSEVSYGKELPLCTQSTESCWAMNRRADVTRGLAARDVTARIRADERREHSAKAATGPSTEGAREQPSATEASHGTH
jgi:outer membrane protein OmpA-like peptidoglycan-associated protein